MENFSSVDIKKEVETDDCSEIPPTSLNSDLCPSQISSVPRLMNESAPVGSTSRSEVFNRVATVSNRSNNCGIGQRPTTSTCSQNDPGLQKVQQFIKMIDDTLLEESRDMGIDIARLLLSAQQKIIAKLLENSSFSKQTREVSSQTENSQAKPVEQVSVADTHFQSNSTLGPKQVTAISDSSRSVGKSSQGAVKRNPGLGITASTQKAMVSSYSPASDVTVTVSAPLRPQFASNLTAPQNLAEPQNLAVHHFNQNLNRANEIGGSEKFLKGQQLRELQQFAAQFRARRIRLGFTQADVGKSLGSVLGTDFFSQTTISRFEALNLSLRNMLKLRPTLELWIENMTQKQCESSPVSSSPVIDGESNLTFNLSSSVSSSTSPPDFSNPLSMRKKRKRRCHIDQSLKMSLEEEFDRNAHPSLYQLRLLSEEMNLDVDTLKTWFSNRRSKFRKEKIQPVSSFVIQEIQKSSTLQSS